MTPREDFMVRVFQHLAQRGIEYCVARNFESVFIDGPSDVDLLARASSVSAVREVCELAAGESGFTPVQAARFANHSWVFAHTTGVLVRIDVDTEVRWRWCHVLSAAEVLSARTREDRFFICSPAHEADILATQIAWRNEVPERYAKILAQVGAPPPVPSRIRWKLVCRTALRPGNWLASVRYASSDIARLLQRCFGSFRAARGPEHGASVVLAGLDGAGKSTLARRLIADATRSRHFAGVRYFHWIPSPFRAAEFPWPAAGDIPRRAPGKHGVALSAFRLVRNIVLAWLGFALVVRPLVRRGWLVIIDRYATNYWLDPDSVRYGGPARWLAWARRLFPKADVLIALGADAETLRSRKRELSVEAIAIQSERLRDLPALALRRVDLDAAQPIDTVVQQALAQLP
ncbi:MAG: hypothetical protein ABMA13_14585 [Chthoniobacteraceae bacterium]